MNLLAAPDKVKDRRLNLLLLASFITAIGLILFAVIAVPRIVENANTTDAIARGDAIAGCRSLFRVDVDDAGARLQVARALLDERTNEGLEAVAVGDDQRLGELVGQFGALRENVQVAAAAVEASTAEFRSLIDLSRQNPDAFLDECERQDP